MFSCKTAGLRNLLTVSPDSGISPRTEMGVFEVVGPSSVFLNLFGARTPQNFVKRFRTTYRIRLIQSNNKVKHNVACYRCIRVKRKLTVINRLIFINRNVAHNEKRN